MKRGTNRGQSGTVLLMMLLAALSQWPAARTAAAAEPPDDAEARRIVENADRANAPPALIETALMVITDEKGAVFERRLRLWSKKKEGGDAGLMRFLSPDEIRGAGLLTHEHRGKDDEQWFYLPATRKIRRISGADRRNRFMGTEFLYQDLQGFHPEDYRYHLLNKEMVDKELCHVVEAVPRAGREDLSAYSREVIWIGVDTAVARKAVLYDEAGKAFKELAVSGVENVRQGVYLPLLIEMSNLRNGRATSLRTLDRELPDELPDSVFSQRELRRRLRPDER